VVRLATRRPRAAHRRRPKPPSTAVDPSIDAVGRRHHLGRRPATPDRRASVRTLSYTRVLQDWDVGCATGMLDAVMPMNYYRAITISESRRRWFGQWLAYERALGCALNAIGNVSPSRQSSAWSV
jgi:uncharacterized lipoprotein YddW (UPF0748 family)